MKYLFDYNKCMRKWRNWYTRTTQNRMVNTMWVQVPSCAPSASMAELVDAHA